MTVLGLHCCTWAFSSWSELRLLFIVVLELLIVVAPQGAQALGTQALVAAAPKLWSTGPIVVLHRLSRSVACGIFLDQGSNPCPLPWQAVSLPLSHHGSLLWPVIMIVVWRFGGTNPAILSASPHTVQRGILFWPAACVCQPLATVSVSSVFLKQSFWGERSICKKLWAYEHSWSQNTELLSDMHRSEYFEDLVAAHK